MRPTLEGATGVDKLDTIRRALGDVRIDGKEYEEGDTWNNDNTVPMPIDVDEEKERWDCETILCIFISFSSLPQHITPIQFSSLATYSNLENHPRVIRVRDSKPTPRIKLDTKSGLPIAIQISASHQERPTLDDVEEEEEDSQDSDATDRRKC